MKENLFTCIFKSYISLQHKMIGLVAKLYTTLVQCLILKRLSNPCLFLRDIKRLPRLSIFIHFQYSQPLKSFGFRSSIILIYSYCGEDKLTKYLDFT